MMAADRLSNDHFVDVDAGEKVIQGFANISGIRISDEKIAQQYREFASRRFDGMSFYFITMLSSAVCFWLLNGLLSRMWSKPKSESKANRALVNNAVSLIHSSVAACVIHYDFKYLNPVMLTDLRHIHSSATLFLIAFCGGYFLYDTMDIRHSATGRALLELVCHHAIIIINYTYVLYKREYVPFCAAFLFCETNSIFLHCRQLMLYNKVPKTSLLFRINAVLNYITFIIYRLYNCYWLLYFMFVNFADMSWDVRFLMVSSVPLITVVQLPLLYRIVYSDWFKLNTQHSKMNFD